MSNVGRRGKLKLESRLRAALLNGTNTRLEHHEIKRVIDALLKPPAREDAQPVAWRLRPNDGLTYDWAVVQSDPNKTAKVRADLYDVEPLYTHPAPDALRVAVEALEALAGEEGDCGEKVYVPCTWKPFREVARQALATLAALQAEQGAK